MTDNNTYNPYEYDEDIFDSEWDCPETDCGDVIEKIIETGRQSFYEEWFDYLEEHEYYD